MTRVKALMILLTAWAFNWISTGEDNLDWLWTNTEVSTAVLIWFGITTPTEEQKDHFFMKFVGWVDHASNRMRDIMRGELSFKDAILEKIVEEVWL